jgi:hypothetical protein
MNEEGVVRRARVAHDVGEAPVRPIELGTLHEASLDRWAQRAEQEGVIEDLQELQVAAHCVHCDAELARRLRVREKLPGAGGDEVLGPGELSATGKVRQTGWGSQP